MKNRLFVIALSLVLMLTMMPMPGVVTPSYGDIEAYPLWVNGKQVTGDNMENVLEGDPTNEGKVSFTPAIGDDPATLILRGATITKGYEYEEGAGKKTNGIFYNGTEPLKVELVDGGINTISNVDNGLNCYTDKSVNLNISGKGTLTINVNETGIAGGETAIDSGTIDIYSSEGGGIFAVGSLTINGDSLNVDSYFSAIYGSNGITINDGTLELHSLDSCVEGNSGVTINGGTVTATTAGMYRNAIQCMSGGVSINGGVVKAAASNTGSAGIYANFSDIIIGEGCEVTASGVDYAIHASGDESVIKNAIAGIGWTDTAGTAGRSPIDISTEGQTLKQYKKVRFPQATDTASVTTAPKAKNLTYNGKAQALVTTGAATGGTMQYAIGKDNKTAPTTGWSSSIPKGTNAGTYYVWYKAAGDEDHNDSEPACAKATVAKEIPSVARSIIRNTIANTAKKTYAAVYDAVPGAAGYDIAYKSKDSGKWVVKSSGKKTRATIGGLTVGGMYQIKVRAKKAETANYKAATGPWSGTLNRYFHTTQKIRLASRSKGSFTMSWKNNPRATSYQVMFSTKKNGAGAAKNINAVGKGKTSFTKTGLKSGRTYYVQVREIVKIGNTNYFGNISCPVAVKVR